MLNDILDKYMLKNYPERVSLANLPIAMSTYITSEPRILQSGFNILLEGYFNADSRGYQQVLNCKELSKKVSTFNPPNSDFSVL